MSLTSQEQQRIAQLQKLGLQYDGEYYYGACENTRDINLHWTEISCDSVQEWSKKLLQLEQEIRRRKQEIKSQH